MKKILLITCVSLASAVSMAQDTLQTEAIAIDSVQTEVISVDSVQTEIFSADPMQTAGEPAMTLEDSLRSVYTSMSSMLKQAEQQKHYEDIWGRRKFINVGYMWGGMKDLENKEKYESEFAFSFSSGKVIYFHKKPIANMVKIGLDAGLDLKINKYKDRPTDDDELMHGMQGGDDDAFHLGYFSLEPGLAIGPSVTVNPVSQLKVKAFFHVKPTYSMLIVDDDMRHSYKTTFTYGGEVLWGRIGIGIEGYTGTAKYNSFTDDVRDSVGGIVGSDGLMDEYMPPKGKLKFRTSGFNLYLAIKI